MFPELAFDSWVTIGLDGPSSASAGEEGVTMLFASGWEEHLVQDKGLWKRVTNGSGWAVIPWTATNTIAGPAQRVLLAQLTTDGHLSGSMRVQVFPQGDNENDLRLDVTFDTNVVCGCLDENAANFNPDANADDGLACTEGAPIQRLAISTRPPQKTTAVASRQTSTCLTAGAKATCPMRQANAAAIAKRMSIRTASATTWTSASGRLTSAASATAPAPSTRVAALTSPTNCDCSGNELDALGTCGGTCEADEDGDGVCDDVDDCVGTLDACGICNGPGAVYECGCEGLAEGRLRL